MKVSKSKKAKGKKGKKVKKSKKGEEYEEKHGFMEGEGYSEKPVFDGFVAGK